ncbi:thioredoxin-disulfide reductase [Caminibacter mediatlanticus TB-2]|uniref:Thioredoxin reductase n=1 Tax=Caminibacter mediatlanticus TB-2 TaxID=391592 RepID=A0ABX5VE81_9BACT|nr:thioredoxin-disulfide reductase [Caminibacter mediatlanticus]QCT95231.1 thioredoxin-disulfide reductase [Caminibacter mediatlanticus TB-2]
MYDVIIIGGGPAGLSAGIYTSRLGGKTLLLEKLTPGGQITLSSEIENYPGICDVKSGVELMACWPNQAKKFGCEIKSEEAKELKIENGKFRIITSNNEYKAKAVIVATGSTPKKAGFEGEDKFIGRGVSYCAVCDGFFYKDKVVAVIGGGDTALEEALYLSQIAKKVYLIHRRDKFRAAPITQKKVFENEKIEIIYNAIVKKAYGNKFLEGIILLQKNKEIDLKVDGVFVFVGMKVNNELIKDLVELNEYGEVKVNLKMETSLKGLYAAGDIREDSVKQVVAAAGDGATAGINAMKLIQKEEE